MIYVKGKQYYIYKNSRYYLADIIIKSHTIVILPTSEYVEELQGAENISYEEVKRRFLK